MIILPRLFLCILVILIGLVVLALRDRRKARRADTAMKRHLCSLFDEAFLP